VLRGERASTAHRSHAYQQLVRRFGQHRRVTQLGIGINLCWLLPYAELQPSRALSCTLAALLPLLIWVFVAGAGRPERASP
jgi:Fuc2NAc and GlcNAc transferase